MNVNNRLTLSEIFSQKRKREDEEVNSNKKAKSTLSNEIWEMIFSSLPFSDIKNLRRCCKDFQQIIDSDLRLPSFFQNICENNKVKKRIEKIIFPLAINVSNRDLIKILHATVKKTFSNQILKSIINSLNNDELSVICDDWTDAKLLGVVKNFPNIKKIYLQAKFLSSEGMAHAISHCSNLEELSLSNCDIEDKTLISITNSCKKINTLDLKLCHNVTVPGLIKAVKQLNLKNLILYHTPKYRDSNSLFSISLKGLESIFSSNPHIEKLSFSCLVQFHDLGVAFEKMTKLRELDLRSSGIKDEDLYTISIFCSNIQKLNLSNCFYLTSEGIAKSLKNIPDLEELSLPSNIQVPDFKVIIKSCQKIKYLNLNNSQLLMEEDFKEVAKLTSLSKLFISYTRINNAAFLAIAQSCQQMTSIHFLNCTTLTGEGIASALKLLPNLNEIEFEDANMNGKDFLQISEVRAFKNIRELNLVSYKNLTGGEIAKVLTDVKDLEVINLSETNIDDAGLLAIAWSIQKSVNTLYLRECLNLTGKGIAQAIKLFNKLIVLDLGSNNFDNDELMEITENCKEVEILEIDFCVNLTNMGITNALFPCTKVRNLNLRGTAIDPTGLILISHRNKGIRELNLGRCQFDGDSVALALVFLPQLREVNLEETDINDDDLIMLSKLNKIKSINVGNCPNITPEGIAAVEALGKVRFI